MFDVGKMVDAVLDAVDKPLRTLHERVKAVETQAPEKGEKGEPGLVGPPGEKGEPGEPGKNGTDGAPADAIALPADLVEQLKSAAQALAELVPDRGSGPRELELIKVDPAADYALITPRHVAGAVITRSGELAISYSDGSGERLGHVIGPQGEKGAAGERGEPGHDGIGMKGEDGPPGRDGVSVTAASINRNGELTLTLSDGSVLSPGRVVAPDKKRA